MAPACPTSGCGSADSVLSTTLQRFDSWVQVRVSSGHQSATWRWYCSSACAAVALGGARAGELEATVRTSLADEIDAAAAALAAAYPGDLLMLARRHGLETARRVVSPEAPAEGEAYCHLCGCTEDDPCAGGCRWVPDPAGMQDTCSNCQAPDAPCETPGCGKVRDLDPEDPATLGWTRAEVAGTGDGPRWYCSPLCVGVALAAAGTELAEDDAAALEDEVAR